MNVSAGLSLVSTLDRRNTVDIIPPYDHSQVDDVVSQSSKLYDDNQRTLEKNNSGELTRPQAVGELHARHVVLLHNRRCLLAYHNERLLRLKRLPWELGSELPSEVDQCMSDSEKRWYRSYSDSLLEYTESLFDGKGFDITRYRKPPKKLLIQVKCMRDHGTHELEDGTSVVLNKNTIHLMPLRDAEHLVHRGILVEIPY